MPNKNEHLLRIVSTLAVLVACVLIAIKVYAWQRTGSVSVLGSLLDSLMDALSSLISFAALRYALRPADDEHRFGHGKAESIAAVAQSVFIFFSGLALLLHSGKRLLWGQEVQIADTDFGMLVMLCVIVITLGLVLFQRYVVRKTGSVLIEADLLHYQSDLMMNASIILALFVTGLGYHSVDAVLGILLSLYIVKAALEIASKGINDLMDRELPGEVVAEIHAIASTHDEVQAVHELRTRQSGSQYIIQMHIELDGTMSLMQSHAIADGLERKLASRFDGADVIIHQDPMDLEGVASITNRGPGNADSAG